MSDEIPIESRRAIIAALIQQAQGSLYSLKIQKRASEICGDEADAKAIEEQIKRMAKRLAVFEQELAELDKQNEPDELFTRPS